MSIFHILAEAAAEHGGEHHGPTLLGLDAEGWVYAGITIFFLIAIFGMKAHKKVLAGLDAQTRQTVLSGLQTICSNLSDVDPKAAADTPDKAA